MNTVTLKVLIVDDSAMYRKIIQSVLEVCPGVEIVGNADNGKIALTKIRSVKPDLVILDIEMPEMDGLEVLEYLRRESSDTAAIVFSTYTTEGARITLRALELGAFDFISKPRSGNLEENMKLFKSGIEPMIDALLRQKTVRTAVKEIPFLHRNRIQTSPIFVPQSTHHEKSRAVAIGISTGGPVALSKLLPKIPADIGIPLFIVQHMPAMFTEALAVKLNAISQIWVREAVDGEEIYVNTAYIAPGGRQMKVEQSAGSGRLIIRLTDDSPENNCKPSADYLFRSIAYCYGRWATGVIMTGMGYDGSEGLKCMKECGAVIIAQDETSCAVYGMPRKPVELGIVDVITPLEQMAEEICRTVR